MSDHAHELIIIGGGPAGLAAGVYAARDGLDCVLLEKQHPGGQVIRTLQIANYPGFTAPSSGIDLADKFRRHAEEFNLAIRTETVRSLIPEGGLLKIATDQNLYRTKTAIIATGSSYKTLGVPGEKRLEGRGVSYCGSCDGPLYKGKSLIVVGGGDTALEEAIFLTRFAREVKLVHRRDTLRATRGLQKQAHATGKIDFLWNSIVREIRGETKVEAAMVEDRREGGVRELACDGVFIFIGSTPNNDFLRGTLALDEEGFVIADISMRTSLPGVFAAGDIRKDSVRQIASAVGDGVTAIMNAERFLDTQP
ncbi:MAG: thioredoxin-disulfide reductase [Candidatus Aureabacteria bacterium]|nr:thioredoxin-disulfide reductase [Candidatus Auribacterota bacterium]